MAVSPTTDRPRVLIVDDQPAVVQALRVLLDLHDIPCVTATGPREAVRVAAAETLGAVVQDMNFARSETSGREGIDLFRTLRRADPELPILLVTAWASLETAVELVREGAADYIQKPWDDERLVRKLAALLATRTESLQRARERSAVERSRRELEERHDLGGLVWASPAMHRLLALAVSVADSDAPVLVTGPSGSGKERVAEIIRANSPRRDGPFVKVNVGAIPEELIESELFGAEPGAYTGADRRRIGHFETADGGTLFLDEIDALSLAGQVKLLRVLQQGEFQRLGSSRTLTADVRVVSASNASLERALAEGRFREDLYFRLNVVELAVPALSQRPEDVLPLARHFLDRYRRGSDPPPELDPAAERALLAHDWPGNVRELENRVRRATVVGRGDRLSAEDLGLAPGDAAQAVRSDLTGDEERERVRVLTALQGADGVVAHAAERLGISRQALYRKMDRLGIEVERRPRG
ncbi:MAG: sigma-54 dependent transcriptional regulator [Thermoanaerobaculia bacterium]|nr:sigma-54 dependent transcriptional regulator [Thermoanaerobaculia bacterium]